MVEAVHPFLVQKAKLPLGVDAHLHLLHWSIKDSPTLHCLMPLNKSMKTDCPPVCESFFLKYGFPYP